jgi:hypothetical protein
MPEVMAESDRTRAHTALVVALALAVAVAAGVAAWGEWQRRPTEIRSEVKPQANLSGALAAGDVGAAERAWNDAYGAALATDKWSAMAEVGDAALRLANATPAGRRYEAKARQAYLITLFRARNDGSPDGILRAAEAFAALGDWEVADYCRRIAEQLTARSEGIDADARLRASPARRPAR